MNARRLDLAIACITAVAAVVATLVGGGGSARDLAILAGAVALCERLELRPQGRAPLSLVLALSVVVVRATTIREFFLVVLPALAVGVAMRRDGQGLQSKLLLFGERFAQATGAYVAYRLVLTAFPDGGRAIVLGGLAAAAVAQLAIGDLVTALRGRGFVLLRGRSADVALLTSAVLMGLSYRGVSGEGDFGLWGPLLFSVPLVAAWYSFSLLASTRRNFDQTLRALSAAPELGGLVLDGHGERVAELAVATGCEVGLGPAELADLEAAALLHHLGAVCLDAPASGQTLDAADVANASAAMLRESEALNRAGSIIAAELLLNRPPDGARQGGSGLPGQILKISSAFDELTGGRAEHAEWAVDALFTGPGYVYDGRVLAALERVLTRRGALPKDR